MERSGLESAIYPLELFHYTLHAICPSPQAFLYVMMMPEYISRELHTCFFVFLLVADMHSLIPGSTTHCKVSVGVIEKDSDVLDIKGHMAQW